MPHQYKQVPDIFLLLSSFRENDQYHEEMQVEKLIDIFFPPTAKDLVQQLSNITAAFYGTLLKTAGMMFGTQQLDNLSYGAMERLAKIVTNRAVTTYPSIDKDARGVMVVLVVAVFTASPEYNIQIHQYGPDHVKLTITGSDRYHIITNALGISDHFTWPVIGPFIRAINKELQLTSIYEATIVVKELDQESRCVYEVDIRKIPVDAIKQPSATLTVCPPYFSLEECRFDDVGTALIVPITHIKTYTPENFGELVRITSCLAEHNLKRLYPQLADRYMLGNQLNTLHYQDLEDSKQLTANISSRLISDRAAFVTVNFFNEGGVPILTIHNRLHILARDIFLQRFSALQRNELPGMISGDDFPIAVVTDWQDPFNYQVFLPPFSHEHCLGHFPGYPCVAATFLYQCTVSHIMDWLKVQRHIVSPEIILQGVEIYTAKPIPIDTACIINMRVLMISTFHYKFIASVATENKKRLDHCTLVIDLGIKK